MSALAAWLAAWADTHKLGSGESLLLQWVSLGCPGGGKGSGKSAAAADADVDVAVAVGGGGVGDGGDDVRVPTTTAEGSSETLGSEALHVLQVTVHAAAMAVGLGAASWWHALLFNASSLSKTIVPTMPDSELASVLAALPNLGFYRCPCGWAMTFFICFIFSFTLQRLLFITILLCSKFFNLPSPPPLRKITPPPLSQRYMYSVGECTMPMESRICPGGKSHGRDDSTVSIVCIFFLVCANKISSHEVLLRPFNNSSLSSSPKGCGRRVGGQNHQPVAGTIDLRGQRAELGTSEPGYRAEAVLADNSKKLS